MEEFNLSEWGWGKEDIKFLKEFVKKIDGKQRVMTLPDGEQVLAVEIDEINKLAGKKLTK